ncbi:ABC transporter permease [Algoriphagus chordae]|uniref:Transport permease protein n=1 Tax=Algoriphagus chordae TaxID=237019 RepID=A0A2W7R3Q5_9BACT|nr:ABC transporter permease [Algoriphagus chordae]PZX50517.1 lipopolysaccharide transport system permease protein [Algoriphagus chordae]
MKGHASKELWDWEIRPETPWFSTSLKELFQYKDLIIQLVRKDFLGSYQQTLLGPFWVLLQPLLTVLIYVLVFNKFIGISTGSTPPFLFNLIGITLWGLFSETFLQLSKTFSQNIEIFSKVYFPRVIVAISSLSLQIILFGIQLLLLCCAYSYFAATGIVDFNFARIFLIFPAIVVTAGIAFGGGLIFSVLTAKYRDLLPLLHMLIRLLMFVCPIFYSVAMVPENIQWVVKINPLSSQFELFRYSFLGSGTVEVPELLYSGGFMIIIVLLGTLLFNKMSDRLMDVL